MSVRLEPSLAALSNPLLRYFLATRPAFLLATLAACLLGLVSATGSGVPFDANAAVCTILLSLLLHAGVNVLNDYFDALNGSDAVNIERLFPYTGGSRFIQNGILTPKQTIRFAYTMLLFSMLGGIWLVWQAGVGLLLIGALGMLVGWAYSATPMRLSSRGLGELCVFVGFLGVIIGADYVQRHAFSFQPIYVGIPYAFLVTNLLYINQFPDRKADAFAGKRHLVVRLPLHLAVWVYFICFMLALVWLCFMTLNDQLPAAALFSGFPLIFSWRAFILLRKYSANPIELFSAIQLTLASMLLHALLLIIILLWKTP